MRAKPRESWFAGSLGLPSPTPSRLRPHQLNSTRLMAIVAMPTTSPYTVSWPLA